MIEKAVLAAALLVSACTEPTTVDSPPRATAAPKQPPAADVRGYDAVAAGIERALADTMHPGIRQQREVLQAELRRVRRLQAGGGAGTVAEYASDDPLLGAFDMGSTRTDIDVHARSTFVATATYLPSIMSSHTSVTLSLKNGSITMSHPYDPYPGTAVHYIANSFPFPAEADCQKTSITASAGTTHSAGQRVIGGGIRSFSAGTSDSDACAQLPASIAVQPGSATIEEGQSVQLSATVRGIDGSVMSCPIEWSSSEPEGASVDQNGTVTGITGEGTYGITATCAGVPWVAGGASVTVLHVPPPPPPPTPAPGAGGGGPGDDGDICTNEPLAGVSAECPSPGDEEPYCWWEWRESYVFNGAEWDTQMYRVRRCSDDEDDFWGTQDVIASDAAKGPPASKRIRLIRYPDVTGQGVAVVRGSAAWGVDVVLFDPKRVTPEALLQGLEKAARLGGMARKPHHRIFTTPDARKGTLTANQAAMLRRLLSDAGSAARAKTMFGFRPSSEIVLAEVLRQVGK